MKKHLQFLHLLSMLMFLSVFGVNAMAWNQQASFNDNRYGAFGFAIGQYGYVGGGVTDGGSSGLILMNDLWSYDSATDQWTQKVSMPGPGVTSAAAFSLYGKGYVVTGSNLVNYTYENWQYDPILNSWQQKSDFPGQARYTTSYFTLGNFAYVGMGYNASYLSDFYKYDGALDTWTQVASIPGFPRQSAKGFSIDNLGYVVGGAEGVNYTQTKDLYCYDPVTDTWNVKAPYPGNGTHGLAAFGINGKGYTGCGTSFAGFGNVVYDDFYEYNPSNDTWNVMPSFGGGIRQGGVSMAIQNSGFVGMGSSVIYPQINYFSDWWKFESPTGIDEQETHVNASAFVDHNNNLVISVNTSIRESAEIQILDHRGRIVASEKLVPVNNTFKMELPQLAEGVYCFRIKNNEVNNASGKFYSSAK
jgi:N-acetylneuraminic acid mutarotase